MYENESKCGAIFKKSKCIETFVKSFSATFSSLDIIVFFLSALEFSRGDKTYRTRSPGIAVEKAAGI